MVALRPRIRLALLVALAFANAAFVNAAPTRAIETPEGEFARIPLKDSIALRVEFKNDSYSIFPGNDWDDFRTFGLYAGVSARGWAFELTADSFTDRGEKPEKGSRVDSVYGIISRKAYGRRFSPAPGIDASAELRIGVGALAIGDFGSIGAQDFVHKAYGCERETPDEPSGGGTEAIGCAAFLAGIDEPRLPLFLATTVELGTAGLARARAMAGLSWRAGGLGARLYGGLDRATGYGSIGGTAFSGSLDVENGWYAGLTANASPIEAGFSWNASENRQSGYVALSFAQRAEGNPAVRTKGFGANRPFPDGKTVSVDFRLLPLYAGVRLRFGSTSGAFTGSVAVGAEGGPLPLHGRSIEYEEHYRYEQAYLGLEIAANAFDVVELYALAGGGVREETRKTATETHARLIDRAVSPMLVGECGIRAYPPLPGGQAVRWGIGGSLNANWSAALFPGWSPLYQLYLTARAR